MPLDIIFVAGRTQTLWAALSGLLTLTCPNQTAGTSAHGVNAQSLRVLENPPALVAALSVSAQANNNVSAQADPLLTKVKVETASLSMQEEMAIDVDTNPSSSENEDGSEINIFDGHNEFLRN